MTILTGWRSISSSRPRTEMEQTRMRRLLDLAGAARLGILAAFLGVGWTTSPAVAQDAASPSNGAPAQSGANDNAAAQRAVQDAIPLTPEMIEELARRYRATRQTQEQAVTEMAVPENRQVNTSFAPVGRPASSRRSRAIRQRCPSSIATGNPGRCSGTPTAIRPRLPAVITATSRPTAMPAGRPPWLWDFSSAPRPKGRTSLRSRRSRWRRAAGL